MLVLTSLVTRLPSMELKSLAYSMRMTLFSSRILQKDCRILLKSWGIFMKQRTLREKLLRLKWLFIINLANSFKVLALVILTYILLLFQNSFSFWVHLRKCEHFSFAIEYCLSKRRKNKPQKLTQLSSRSHPRHLVGKMTAQKDTIIDIHKKLR